MGVKSATAAELTDLRALDTVEGQIALSLAEALDDRAGIQAGGLASTAKQLAAVMTVIREKAPKAQDEIESLIEDEVGARREANSGADRGAGTARVVRTTERANRGR